MFATWRCTVCSLITSRAAISRLLSPSATSASTSSSRGESSPSGPSAASDTTAGRPRYREHRLGPGRLVCRAQLPARRERSLALPPRGHVATESVKRRRVLEPQPGGLERRLARRQDVERVLEPAPRLRVLAAGGRKRAPRRERGRPHRPRAHPRGDLPQLAQRRRRTIEVAQPGLGPHGEFEPGPTLGPAPAGEAPQVAVGELRGLLGAALVKRPDTAVERCQGVSFAAREQLHGVVRATLAPAKLGQADERVPGRRRTGRCQVVGGRAKLPLCLLPTALPREDGAVVRPAEAEHEPDPVPLAELAHPAAPFTSPIDVTHPLAGGDHVAAGPGHADQELRLTGNRRRGRLVKTAHALPQLPLADQRPSLKPQPEHLQLGHPELPADLDGARGEPPGGGRVLLERHRDMSLMEREPTVIRPRFEVVEQAVGALEPAVGDSRLAAEPQAIERVPGGHPGRRPPFAALAIEAVGPLAGVEGESIIVEHVADPTQALERLGRLLERQGIHERGPRAITAPCSRAFQSCRSGKPKRLKTSAAKRSRAGPRVCGVTKEVISVARVPSRVSTSSDSAVWLPVSASQA
jgi:hypothetical protein